MAAPEKWANDQSQGPVSPASARSREPLQPLGAQGSLEGVSTPVRQLLLSPRKQLRSSQKMGSNTLKLLLSLRSPEGKYPNLTPQCSRAPPSAQTPDGASLFLGGQVCMPALTLPWWPLQHGYALSGDLMLCNFLGAGRGEGAAEGRCSRPPHEASLGALPGSSGSHGDSPKRLGSSQPCPRPQPWGSMQGSRSPGSAKSAGGGSRPSASRHEHLQGEVQHTAEAPQPPANKGAATQSNSPPAAWPPPQPLPQRTLGQEPDSQQASEAARAEDQDAEADRQRLGGPSSEWAAGCYSSIPARLWWRSRDGGRTAWSSTEQAWSATPPASPASASAESSLPGGSSSRRQAAP